MKKSLFIAVVLASTAAHADNGAIDKSKLPFCDDVEKLKAKQAASPERVTPAEPQAVSADSQGAPGEGTSAPLDVEARMKTQDEQMKAIQERLDQIQQKQQDDSSWLDLLKPLHGRFGGFLDFGAFYVQGDGSGIRPDYGHLRFPQYRYIPATWVFYGDPLGTQINSRGDPADTGQSRAVTINDIGNQGKFTFIVNSINFNIFAALGDDLTLNASVDFLPRGRDPSSPGVAFNDFIDIRFAYAEYIAPVKGWALSLYAGKVDPVFGMEYRGQDAPDRLTVTPSLICRYTCGRVTGLKARAKFLNDHVNLALSVSNDPSVTEYFPFANQIAQQNQKVGQGRLGGILPVGSGWEFGVSGGIGAQSFQPSDYVYQWQFGIDTRLNIRGLEFTAEFVKGKADGKTNKGSAIPYDAAPLLDFEGAYGLIGYHVTNWFEPFLRVDWRQALELSGANFAYVTREIRGTLGVRFEIGQYVIVKGEYTKTWQVHLPQFNDDVATASLVIKY